MSDCAIIYALLIIEHNGDVSPVNYAFYVKTAANQDFARMSLWAGLHTLRAAGRWPLAAARWPHAHHGGSLWGLWVLSGIIIIFQKIASFENNAFLWLTTVWKTVWKCTLHTWRPNTKSVRPKIDVISVISLQDD